MKQLYNLKPSLPYLLLFGIFLTMYAWRATSVLWFTPISSHISNFAIMGGAIMLLIGTRDFELRTSRNKVLQILVTFTVANLVLETLNIGDLNLPGLTFRSFNTPDILDALYGIGAITLIALVYGRRTHMFGHFVKK